MNTSGPIAAGTHSDGLGVPPADRWASILEAFERSVWVGDHRGAEEVVASALARGCDLSDLYERVIAPALHRVGASWSAGELTIADEHLATEATLRAMGGAIHRAKLGRGRELAPRCVVTAAVTGDRHGVGLRMAADALELAGHEVIHCGADTPLEDIVSTAAAAGADAVVISFTMACSGEAIATIVEQLRRGLPGTSLLIGGQGIPSGVATAALRIDTLEDLVGVVGNLPPRPSERSPQPRRFNPLVRQPAPPRLVPPPPAASELGGPHLQAVLTAGHDAVALLDRGGAVVAWNPAAEAMFGHRAEDAVGRHVDALVVAPERGRMIRRCLRETLAGETIELREPHTSPDDGTPLTVLLRMAPVTVSGKAVGTVLIARDVTVRRGVEDGGRRSHAWRSRVDHALAEDHFMLAAQPVLDLTTEEVNHCELLLRMRMGGKILMPSEFIPPTEHSGQIRAIDNWVIDHGIGLAAVHPIAINLSAASLANPALPGRIETAVADAGVDPGRIIFEIAEIAAAENLEEASRLVTRLRELGCRVALDDFGTGSASFEYLSRLPVTKLKIHDEFARGLSSDDAVRRVIDAVVTVGDAFGIRTVAEGIEDEETLAILREAGIDLGQGWLFGKPQLIEEEILS